MMVPKKSLLLAGAALTLFSASAGAQSAKVQRGLNKAPRSAQVDLASGTITKGAAISNRFGTTTQDFNNGDSLAITVDTGSGFCEWYTVGVKGYNGNQSDLMANVRFVYCSSAGDVYSGGPGGTTKLGFYEGYALGGPLPTLAQTVAAFTLTGLPANTGSACFIPWLASTSGCWAVVLTFGTQICFADGPIAYSWKFVDMDTCGPWSHTFPTFACVTSCSTNPLGGPGTYPAGAAPVDGQGMTDFVDQYCPPATLLATFTFNSVPGTTPMFTGQNMRIRECTDLVGTIAGYNATAPANTDLFSSTPAVLGQTWTATTTRVGGTGGFFRIRIQVPGGKANLKCSTVWPAPAVATGRALITGNSASWTQLPSPTTVGSINQVGNTQGVFSQLIPCDPALIGVYWTGQSTVMVGAAASATRRCTSAVDGTVGSL
jgi:hypothetical protein